MENKPQEIFNNSQKLKLSDTISFSCRKELPCFNKCCADINIVLTPYDIIRLKNTLNITSVEFLEKYAVLPFNKQQKLPVVILKMGDTAEKSCQLLSEAGCSVYEDRPWACRMYPVGLAAPAEGSSEEPFYFLMEEPGCHGLKEKREITVEDWIKEQGVDEYEEIGRLFAEITMHPVLLAGMDLDPQKMEMFYMVCYNIDKYRRFVFESSFLKSFEVDEATVEKITNDDVELLKFGFQWLKFSLFKEKTMTVKPEVLKEKKTSLKDAKVK